jgi:hypothetical protein
VLEGRQTKLDVNIHRSRKLLPGPPGWPRLRNQRRRFGLLHNLFPRPLADNF